MIPSTRTFRAWIGFLVILVDVATFAAGKLVPLFKGAELSWDMGELLIHVVFLFLGLLLIDATIASTFFDKLGRMLPWTKGGSSGGSA